MPAVPRRAVRARLPGRHRHSRLHPEDRRKAPPRRVRHHHRHEPAAVDLRPRVPAGKPVRRRVHGRRHAGARRDRASRALRRRHGDQGRLGQHPVHRAVRLQGRHRRRRPGRHGLRGGHGEGRLRGHRLRGVPSARRRAEVRHSGFPAAERGDRRRDRQAEAARHQVRVQHAGRPAVHDRADGHRDGVSRGFHRHRRRISELHGHSGRVAQRRALRQRAPDPLQPDARPRLPEFRHAAEAGQGMSR